MNKRIKEVRKYNKLTQQKFADILNISKSAVESYEYGRIGISDRTIKDICRNFHVNETWLRTGDGEMLAPITREQEIAELTAGMFKEENDFKRELLKLIAQADEKQIEVMREMVRHLSEFTD